MRLHVCTLTGLWSIYLGQPWVFQVVNIDIGTGQAQASPRQRRFVPPPPRGLSTSGRRSSAGSRADSTIELDKIAVIVPEFELTVDFLPIPQVWLLSENSHPTFWIYLPPASLGKTLVFRIELISGKVIHQQSIPISQIGLSPVKLPELTSGLVEGKL
jgi:hypothetical protein